MPPKRYVALLAGCFFLSIGSVPAQPIELDFQDVTLRDALVAFGDLQGVDLVYSERLVQGYRVSCQYRGVDLAGAIRCILGDTPISAQRLRRRQYVLTPVPVEPQPGLVGMIRGFVSDAHSGERLPGANIYLADIRFGTSTNEAGYFAISRLPRAAYATRVSFMGYGTLDTMLVADADSTVDLQLGHEAIVQETQVVEAPQTEPFAVEPGIMRVPTGMLQRLPGAPGESDLLHSLRWLPGVQRAGASASGLVIRGSAPDQILYLLDGAPIYHPWHAFSIVSTFQSEAFKDVRLYRGSFPAEYGGRLSAVLDAELKDGHRDEIAGSAAVGIVSGRLLVEAPLNEKTSIMVAVRRSYLDRIVGTVQPVRSGGVADTMRTGYYFLDVTSKVTWRPTSQQRLSLSVYGGRDAFDLRLPFDITLNFTSILSLRDWLRPSELFFEVDTHWDNYVANARYQYLFSDRLFLTAGLYWSNYIAAESIYIQPVVSSSVTSRYRVNLHDSGLKLDVDYYPSLTHQIRAGVRAVGRRFRSTLSAHIQRTPGSVDVMDQDSRLLALEVVGYVQDTWQPTATLQVQPGLRASILSGGSRLMLDPRLGVRYDAGTVVLRGAAGAQVQYVHRIRDRYSFLYDLVSARWVPASGMLDPSRSLSASLGAAISPMLGMTVSLDAFWHTANGILLPIDETRDKDGLEGPGIELGTLLGQYTRGRARAYGLEFMARARSGAWQYWLSYAAGRSESRTPELLDRSYRPARYDVPQSLQWALLREVQTFTVSVSAVWRSGYPITVPVARYAVQDPLDDVPQRYLHRPVVNNGRLPDFFRLGVMASYWFRFRSYKVTVQAQVYNITNRRNVIGRVYDPSTSGPVGVENRFGFPLIPLIEIKVEL